MASRRKWTAEEDTLLGTGPDPEVADRLGVTKESVFARRAKLGIPPYRRKHVPWTAAEDALLDALPPEDVVVRTGRTAGAVLQRRHERGLSAPRAKRLRSFALLGRPVIELAEQLAPYYLREQKAEPPAKLHAGQVIELALREALDRSQPAAE